MGAIVAAASRGRLALRGRDALMGRFALGWHAKQHLRFSLLGRKDFARLARNSVVAGWSANPIQHTFHGLLRGGRAVLLHANAPQGQLEKGLWATVRQV